MNSGEEMTRPGKVSWRTWAGRLGVTVIAMFASSLGLSTVARADLGFVPGSVSIRILNANGTRDTLAGSHPYEFSINFELNKEPDGHIRGGVMRNTIVKLPSGLFGNPRAVPACPLQEFEIEQCPVETQVGVLHVNIVGGGQAAGPVYNLVSPPGSATELGYQAAEYLSRQLVSVLSNQDYRVAVDAVNSPVEVSAISETIWGVPADPRHDNERGQKAFGAAPTPSSSVAPLQPFVTLPTSCEVVPKMTVEVDSVEDPDHYVSETVEPLDPGGNPAPFTGCEAVPFAPRAVLQPTSSSASTATGFAFELKLPGQNLLNPEEGSISESQPRKTALVLPAGMTVNPSMAVGIGTCSEAQYAAEQPETLSGYGCPESSKIADVTARSPLIEEEVEGGMYLATPYANPSKDLLAVYIVARARGRGVLIKQPGSIDLDPNTGQVTATFDNLPQLPYSTFEVHLREGTRAPLVTPPACGSYESQANFLPFSAMSDAEAKTVSASFQIEQGADGTPCPAGGVPPFAPKLTAGTLNNAAGHYSPLYLRIERQDGEQEITGFSTLLPPGLSGNLSGIPFCGDAAIQHAREQSGSEAEANPACPAASKIGHTIAEAGVGGVLAQAPGNMYLAGPFEGAPFSIVSISSAKVGPFDLGTVVVHLPLRIDPVTAQVSIPSGPADQIPHIIKGVVVHIRAINVWIDRQDFTLNPTSCQAMSLASTINGSGPNVASPADDTTVASSDRFQAAECANLGFKPTFKVTTSGKTSRKRGASLHVLLAYPKAPQGTQADIRSVKVDLPKRLPSRLTTLQKACKAAQFEANPAGCPSASVVGHAKAVTPILPVPLEGPAYFVSYGSAKFPELVLVLQGYGVTIDLHGETFISKVGITSSTFRTIPDQPVTSFELTLPQGKYSALAANGNLCASKLSMPTLFNGQNGAVVKQSTPVAVTGCPKKKAKHKAKKARKASSHNTAPEHKRR
jgi:hypothetical protein